MVSKGKVCQIESQTLAGLKIDAGGSVKDGGQSRAEIRFPMRDYARGAAVRTRAKIADKAEE